MYSGVESYVVVLFTDKSFNTVSYVGKSPTQKTDKIHTTQGCCFKNASFFENRVGTYNAAIPILIDLSK